MQDEIQNKNHISLSATHEREIRRSVAALFRTNVKEKNVRDGAARSPQPLKIQHRSAAGCTCHRGNSQLSSTIMGQPTSGVDPRPGEGGRAGNGLALVVLNVKRPHRLWSVTQLCIYLSDWLLVKEEEDGRMMCSVRPSTGPELARRRRPAAPGDEWRPRPRT